LNECLHLLITNLFPKPEILVETLRNIPFLGMLKKPPGPVIKTDAQFDRGYEPLLKREGTYV
jgi:hypothetical protein